MSQWLLENLAEFIIIGNSYSLFLLITDWLQIRKLEKEKAASEKRNLELELKVMKLEKTLKDVTTILKTSEDHPRTDLGSPEPDRQSEAQSPPTLDPATTISLA